MYTFLTKRATADHLVSDFNLLEVRDSSAFNHPFDTTLWIEDESIPVVSWPDKHHIEVNRDTALAVFHPEGSIVSTCHYPTDLQTLCDHNGQYPVTPLAVYALPGPLDGASPPVRLYMVAYDGPSAKINVFRSIQTLESDGVTVRETPVEGAAWEEVTGDGFTASATICPLSMALHNNKLYIMHSQASGGDTTLEIYNPATNIWTSMVGPAVGNSSHNSQKRFTLCIRADGSMLVFYADGDGYLNWTKYDTTAGAWASGTIFYDTDDKGLLGPALETLDTRIHLFFEKYPTDVPGELYNVSIRLIEAVETISPVTKIGENLSRFSGHSIGLPLFIQADAERVPWLVCPVVYEDQVHTSTWFTQNSRWAAVYKAKLVSISDAERAGLPATAAGRLLTIEESPVFIFDAITAPPTEFTAPPTWKPRLGRVEAYQSLQCEIAAVGGPEGVFVYWIAGTAWADNDGDGNATQGDETANCLVYSARKQKVFQVLGVIPDTADGAGWSAVYRYTSSPSGIPFTGMYPLKVTGEIDGIGITAVAV